MSPACALTLDGENMSEPLGPPTLTMCVLTMPAGVVEPNTPVAADPNAEPVADARMESMEDCAAAKPITADTMVALEKYILNMMLFFSK